MEVDMRGAEDDEPEMSFRRGYQQGVIDIFCAIERCLNPTTREVLQAWIEKDVSMWRAKAMLGHPPNWRLNMIAGPRSMREGNVQPLRLLADVTGPACGC
jgi:hypothetical protein